ncbi:MAG: Gfo/Idh/MocA family oxidoreductase [Rhizobiales bacterium]|nr:Gfo/Idh/MocA family oxidoreductase [Hyphomicrobiales bacterium]
MRRLRTAVVGPGRISQAHLTAIRNNPDLGELAAVVGLPEEAERTRKLASQFGAKRASNSLDEILADPDIDAIVLTVPNHLHGSIAIKALKAGKHVLVEKPLANTAAEVDDMMREAAAAKRTLMAAQCRRFFPGAREVKKRIANLGRPLDIVHILGVDVASAKVDWWKSATDTGGLVLGLNGPHVVDTILWFMGEVPIRVYAQTGRQKSDHWEGEDQATVVMTFKDGSTATGHLSFNMRPETNERWIIGPKGSMHLVHDRTLWIEGKKVVEGKLTPYIEGDESFDNQFKEFASAIFEGRLPLASAHEVRPVIRVLEAALESAKRNQPIEI